MGQTFYNWINCRILVIQAQDSTYPALHILPNAIGVLWLSDLKLLSQYLKKQY